MSITTALTILFSLQDEWITERSSSFLSKGSHHHLILTVRHHSLHPQLSAVGKVFPCVLCLCGESGDQEEVVSEDSIVVLGRWRTPGEGEAGGGDMERRDVCRGTGRDWKEQES